MGKSLRSKTKRAFRRVKRESGVFAIADAARSHRLSMKLQAKLGKDERSDVGPPHVFGNMVERMETAEGFTVENKAKQPPVEEAIELPSTNKVSTSGRRLSRRDAWRLSKGKSLHTKNPDKVNRLGGVAAKRKAGRSKRRR